MNKKSILTVLGLILVVSFLATPINYTYSFSAPSIMEVQAKKRLKIKVLEKPRKINKGSYAIVIVKTKRKAKCSIAVYYKSKSTAKGLRVKKADRKGIVQRRWLVSNWVKAKKAKIVIKAKKKGRIGRKTIRFRVVG